MIYNQGLHGDIVGMRSGGASSTFHLGQLHNFIMLHWSII